ncbi:MAG TPA: cold shock domain-containing protein [Pirellulales bacterium]|nr:cold shock domain-containing protein [Pirellulales bacterium]
MLIGLIKLLHLDKTYGFIAPEGGGREVFFFGSVVADEAFAELWEGQQVSYELAPARRARPGETADERGPRASHVRPLRLTRTGAPAEPAGHASLPRHNRSLAKKPSWRR